MRRPPTWSEDVIKQKYIHKHGLVELTFEIAAHEPIP